MKKALLLSAALGFFGAVFAQTGGVQKLPASQNSLNGKMSKSGYTTVKKVGVDQPLNTNHNAVTRNVSVTHLDDSILPLSPNGNLLSVGGFEVAFEVPSDPQISNICHTPRPNILGGPKNASCGFVVPCDDPSNRDAALTTLKYFQLEWHVMMDGGPTSNIDQARIDDLMAELNADFAAYNMVFCSNPANFSEDAVNYTHDENTEEFSLKNAYNVTPTEVINIYVVGSMGPGGYARFPYDPSGGMSATGGIVLNRGNCTVGTHTLAHEMGHVFGLEHTFSGVDERSECSSCYERVRNANGSSNTSGVPTPLGGPYLDEGDREGDWCSDTNPHDTYAYNCSTSSNANGPCDSNPWNNAPVNNHMSYSFCSSQFTDQQSRRMHCMINTYLGTWVSNGGGICGSLPPDADFEGTPTTWQAPSTVDFTDLSTPSAIVTGWTWTFDVGAGGNGVSCAGCTGANATFVGQTPPTVTYPNPGLYTVSLTVASSNGNDTETKVDYIVVNAPAGDCDTLTTQWETPAPTIITYGFGGGWIAGVPDPVNLVLPTDAKGVYESYFSPNPGTTPVGGVRVGLGSLFDPNDDMTFQVTVYDDDGAGAPGALVGGVGGISPTQLGVPGAGFYNEFWIPFQTAPVPTTAQFHVGVEIFAGDAADTLVVMTSCLGAPGCPIAQGETDASNHIFTSGFGYENLLTVYGADFDVDIIPMLGGYAPLPVVTGFDEDVQCDTTFVTIFDTVLYSIPTGMSFTFSDGTVINSATDPGSIDRVYTTPGPDTVTITAVNDCGRTDTAIYIIPYNFLETPDADFAAVQPNPVCQGAPGVDFAANTAGYDDYTWDFGDGTVVSTAGVETANHVYTAPGTYYVELTTDVAGFLPADTLYLEDFESGWPAGYDRYNNDAFTPNAGVNPPFTGTNATAWLDLDFNGNGNTSATSTSWNGGPTETADDWMLTTAIATLPANQRLFWDAQAFDAAFADGYEVRISTTQLPANTTNYSDVLFSTTAENSFVTARSADLSAYAGQTVYIAFRNNSTDMFVLSIDNIRVGTATTGCSATLLKTDYIEVIDCSVIPPTTVLSASASSGCAPLTVNFTDVTTAGDPATSWLWNFGDGTFSTMQNPGPHVYSAAGTYFVSLESCNTGGCTTDNLTINVTAPPTISNIASTDPTCASASGSIVITAAGGTSPLQYSIDNGVTFQASNTFTGLGAATYNVIVEDAVGCSANSATTLNLPASPTVSGASATLPSCFGGNDGTLTITATGGDGGPYSYSIDNGVTFQAGTTFTGLSAATYNIVVEDGNGCQGISTGTVSNPPQVTYSVVIADENCGAVDGSITLTAAGGDGGPYSYSIDNGVTFQASGSFTGLAASAYNVVVEDASGCQTTATETVSGTGAANIDAIVEDISLTCNGDCNGQLTATVSGGVPTYVYDWVDGVGTSVGSTATISGLCAGTYTLTVTDNGGAGCDAVQSFTLTEPTAVSFGAIITDEACLTSNGTIEFSGATGGDGGPYSYSIDNGVTFQAGTTFTGLSAATYNVVVEDGSGCQATGTATVNSIAGATITNVASVDPSCGLGNGTITITASGGTGALLYSIDGGVTFQSSNTFAALGNGTYDIVVEDAIGCQTTSPTITFNDPGAPTIDTVVATDANCGNIDGSITITATGGTAPLQYSIDNGVTFQAGNAFAGLGAATYDIMIEDANGCSATTSEVINASTAVTVVVDSTDNVLCTGDATGTASITVSGGTVPYTFDWSNDGTGDNDDAEDVTGLPAGTYTVDITDVNGCTTSTSVTITETAAALNLTAITTDEIVGNDGTIDLTVTGGTPPYIFDWDNDGTGDNDDTEDLTGLSGTTTYQVVVTDANGCTDFLDATVTSVVGLDESANDMGVSVYPNPNTGEFYVAFENFDGAVRIEVTDVAGKLIYVSSETAQASNAIKVSIGDVSTGMYFINVKGEDTTFSTRLLKR